MKKEKNMSGSKATGKKSAAKTPAKGRGGVVVKKVERPKTTGLQSKTVVNYNEDTD